MQKRLFFKNAAIMTVTSLLLRTIGIFFRIYVSNRVGAEGMGLYQLIISVYVLAASFASAGMTTAVTRLCTDTLAHNRPLSAIRALRFGVIVSIIIGVLSAVIITIGAPLIADCFLHDMRAVPALRILTVSLPFMGISSCIKGYFLARRKVTCSSIAQILEQIVRIIAISLILSILNVQTVQGACFAILLGDTIAEAVSCTYMGISYFIDRSRLNRKESPLNRPRILTPMLRIAVPITAGRYLGSGLRTVENLIVPTALTVFTSSREVALSQFGKLKGMALPVLFFPSSFLNAFTALLIPEISEAKALHQQERLQRTVKQSVKITILSSVLIGGIFWMLATPLGRWIYHDSEVGHMMRVLAPLTPIMYLESVVVGILKGLDQQTHSLYYSVIDSLSRIALIMLLLPNNGINGFFGVMVFSNILTCSLNTFRLLKVTGVTFCIFDWLIKPIGAVAAAIYATTFLVRNLPIDLMKNTLFFTTISIIVISAVYLTLITYFGCITRSDIAFIKPQKSARS